MARRGNNDGEGVNLFPFLSILVCIIGCLTLIIVVINLIAMNKGEGRTPKEVERAQEFVKLQQEKEEKQKDLDELRQLIENLIQDNKDTLAARDKLMRLKEMLENQEEVQENREELIAKYNLLLDSNKKLVSDEKVLQEEIKKKEEEIAKRKLPPDPAALVVRPSGSSSVTRPFFAEISAKGIYIHRSLTGEPEAIPIATLNQSEEFQEFLQTINSEAYNRLIFLVRSNPEAVQTLNKATALVRAYNAQNGSEIIPGKLPLPGEGKVDLNMFAQYLEP
ncbi:MAG: hypothetical protein CMO55_19140 [Verrucomicrobiales bacterium]|nr:hypothetical protein [Verrucomicrobiales bacterium]